MPLSSSSPRASVELWRIQLQEAEREPQERIWNVLSEEERERAGRFRFARDRVRFVAVHGAVRLILAAYMDCAPEQLLVEYNKHGKPCIAATSRNHPKLRFSISHSEAVALLAVCQEDEVGVDIESLRLMPESLAIARRFFSPQERSTIEQANGHERDLLFFRIWTRKEAYLKGIGRGLSAHMRRFTVPLGSEPGRVLTATGSPVPGHWWVCSPELSGEFVCALATRFVPQYVLLREWNSQCSAG